MLEIKHRTIRKKITIDEFLKLKKDEHGPFAQMRQDAKAINVCRPVW